MESPKTVVHGFARLLGYAGLIPFVVLSGLIVVAGDAWRPLCVSLLRAYAACIASFLGAIHWGLVMKSATPRRAAYVWGVIPCLLASASLLPEPPVGLGMIAAVLWLCYVVDHASYPGFGLAHWLRMRLILTAVASLACIGPRVLA